MDDGVHVEYRDKAMVRQEGEEDNNWVMQSEGVMKKLPRETGTKRNWEKYVYLPKTLTTEQETPQAEQKEAEKTASQNNPQEGE